MDGVSCRGNCISCAHGEAMRQRTRCERTVIRDHFAGCRVARTRCVHAATADQPLRCAVPAIKVFYFAAVLFLIHLRKTW